MLPGDQTPGFQQVPVTDATPLYWIQKYQLLLLLPLGANGEMK